MPQRSTGRSSSTSTDERPWTPDGFRASWGKACKKAGIAGVTFNDLRGTAVTRLALVDCTEAQIASITGHSLRDVRSILDAHYLHRDIELARERDPPSLKWATRNGSNKDEGGATIVGDPIRK